MLKAVVVLVAMEIAPVAAAAIRKVNKALEAHNGLSLCAFFFVFLLKYGIIK